jgi:glycosyltransferase involved in cell wall biosynthesis
MRLLVITQVFWPENFRINDLVEELSSRGHQVTVLTGVPNYPEGTVFPEFRADPGRFANLGGAEIIRVPIIARGTSKWRLVLNYVSFAVAASVFGMWRLRRKTFDAIFVYEPSPVTVGIPAVLFRIFRRIPVVFWVLDLWPETLQAIGVVRSHLLLRAVGSLVSFIYNRCDLILAQSRSFVPQIRKYCAANIDVTYFPSWAEVVFEDPSAPAAPEVSVHPGVFSVMFAGNIGEAQDFPAILDAADILKSNEHIRWLIVGDGRMGDWVRREIVRRGLEKSVLLLGRHSLERMPSFYRHASALLLTLQSKPIFSMTIPGKLQSYLAAGIPIIAMIDGEGADVVRRAEAGIVCSAGDSAALASAVTQMAALPYSERERMGRNGLQVSADEFNRARLIDKLELLLASVAGRRSSTRG